MKMKEFEEQLLDLIRSQRYTHPVRSTPAPYRARIIRENPTVYGVYTGDDRFLIDRFDFQTDLLPLYQQLKARLREQGKQLCSCHRLTKSDFPAFFERLATQTQETLKRYFRLSPEDAKRTVRLLVDFDRNLGMRHQRDASGDRFTWTDDMDGFPRIADGLDLADLYEHSSEVMLKDETLSHLLFDRLGRRSRRNLVPHQMPTGDPRSNWDIYAAPHANLR
jgi:hypothetical protein